ncbi:MAG: ferrous iron transport protein B [Candidatus Bipolaricaulia bacterium]
MASTVQPTGTATRTLALVGPPNVGKSAVFAQLTGRYAVCSNYPGTTVELFCGLAHRDDGDWSVVDTPGVVDLTSSREDEQVSRDVALFGHADVVVQVADAKNLERDLVLTAQLAELGAPVVLDLNMADERRSLGLSPASAELSAQLGLPVVETVAPRGEGMGALDAAIAEARVPALAVDYGPAMERVIKQLEAELGPAMDVTDGAEPVQLMAASAPADGCHGGGCGLSTGCRGRISAAPRGVAALLLSLAAEDAEALLGRMELAPERHDRVNRILAATRQAMPHLAYEMTLARRRAVEALLSSLASTDAPATDPSVPTARSIEPSWRDRLARWTIHPVGGVVTLLAVLYGMYQFVGVFGAQVLVEWFEGTLFGEHINPAIVAFFDQYVPVPFLQELFVGQFGIITMAITYSVALILPIVTTFFLAFGFLEDSGYFARLAVTAHRMFRKMGLSGQAVLPMILGLGCDTMATVTTRTLETGRERVIATLLLALAVPCSAQMAVLLAMGAAISPWVLVGVLGIAGAEILLVGRLAAKILPGESAPFVLELPPLRRPQVGNILAKTRLRLQWYVTEVIPLFVIGTLVLFGLDKAGVLALLQDALRPIVVGLLDLPADAAQAFIMGFFRRDYGAAGLFQLQQAGGLTVIQVLVSLTVITLFVPCIANLLVIIKERGWRIATGIVVFVIPYAALTGALLNWIVRAFGGGS